ncbi:hypothetical protein COY25_02735 [Candidatus Uhrbacteria bacterium CG_4_10_14_0_2_um_filter_41_7]|nr:MAG: hypothetical protein COY25_02735 [Candidatus Uhrbacteria bacterium CG_4_10_14_0_2_um_filter_41_7]
MLIVVVIFRVWLGRTSGTGSVAPSPMTGGGSPVPPDGIGVGAGVGGGVGVGVGVGVGSGVGSGAGGNTGSGIGSGGGSTTTGGAPTIVKAESEVSIATTDDPAFAWI